MKLNSEMARRHARGAEHERPSRKRAEEERAVKESVRRARSRRCSRAQARKLVGRTAGGARRAQGKTSSQEPKEARLQRADGRWGQNARQAGRKGRALDGPPGELVGEDRKSSRTFTQGDGLQAVGAAAGRSSRASR